MSTCMPDWRMCRHFSGSAEPEISWENCAKIALLRHPINCTLYQLSRMKSWELYRHLPLLHLRRSSTLSHTSSHIYNWDMPTPLVDTVDLCPATSSTGEIQSWWFVPDPGDAFAGRLFTGRTNVSVYVVGFVESTGINSHDAPVSFRVRQWRSKSCWRPGTKHNLGSPHPTQIVFFLFFLSSFCGFEDHSVFCVQNVSLNYKLILSIFTSVSL